MVRVLGAGVETTAPSNIKFAGGAGSTEKEGVATASNNAI